MNYPKHRNFNKRRNGRTPATRNNPEFLNRESGKTESSYLKSLMDSRAKVTVTMKSGEKFRGRIRYYDQYCFSVGLLSEKRKIFLRKENVSYITEE